MTGSGLILMRIYAIAKKGIHNNNTIVQFVTLYFIICIEFLSYLDVSFIHDHPLLYGFTVSYVKYINVYLYLLQYEIYFSRHFIFYYLHSRYALVQIITKIK